MKGRIQNTLARIDPPPVTLIRIAIRETEAFYLGDKAAIRKAFPRLNSKKLEKYHPSSKPEMGNWELFAEVIGDSSEDKVRWAEAMARTMQVGKPFPKQNRSTSFRHFCRAVLHLVGEVSR